MFDVPGTNLRLVNYRGTDDQSTVAIPTAECKFFPLGAEDFFDYAMGPHETFAQVNQPGQNLFSDIIFEREGNRAQSRWARVETYSYPLFMCKQPRALRKAVAQ